MKKRSLLFGLACLLAVGSVLETAAQTRIRFARGRTSATVSGRIGADGVRRFVLGARNGQYLSGNISSRGDCVKFTEGSTSVGFTTESGDNWLSVTNYCGRPASFTMTVSINYGSD